MEQIQDEQDFDDEEQKSTQIQLSTRIQAARTIFYLAQTQNYEVLDRLKRMEIIEKCLDAIQDCDRGVLIQMHKGGNAPIATLLTAPLLDVIFKKF